MKKLIKTTFIFSLFLVISSCFPGEAESENQNSNSNLPSIQQSSDNPIESSFDSISSEETPHEHVLSVWKHDDNYHWRECTECGAIVSKENHKFNVATIDPTFEERGYTMHACEVCSFSYKDNYVDKLIPKYTVTWNNWDGTLLELDEDVEAGSLPSYDGAVPEREGEDCFYIFKGWDYGLNDVQNDITYTAVFEKAYKISWINFDGSILDEEIVKENNVPEFKLENPQRQREKEDGAYFYTFSGWYPEVMAVNCNQTYTAQFEKNLLFTFKGFGSYYALEKINNKNIDWAEIPNEYEGFPVTKILKNAFDGCSILKSITIPGSIQIVENDVFKNCSLLANIKYVGNIDSWISLSGKENLVGDIHLFLNDTENETYDITIPDSVDNLSDNAFKNCVGLKNVVVPNSVLSISKSAFVNCDNLKSLALPFVGNSATSNQFLGYIFGGSTYSSNEECVPNSLTAIILNDACQAVPEYAFYGCSHIESVLMPDSIKSIGSFAFYNCTSFNIIDIPTSVLSIGHSAFFGCRFSSEIVLPFIPGGFLGYMFGASSHSENPQFVPETIKKVTLSDYCESLPDYCFDSCSMLTSISIGRGVSSISSNAFYGCSELTEINVDENNQYYCSLNGDLYNKNQTSVILCFPNKTTDSYTFLPSVNNVAPSAFINCDSSIYHGTLDDWLSLTGKQYLSTNVKLFLDGNNEETTSIIVPGEIGTIGEKAFNNCCFMKTVVISEGITSIKKGAFYNCSSLETVVLPNSLITIESNAFTDCSSLETIVLPNSLKTIENYAFSGCSSLKTIVIPDSVTELGYAFIGCTSLESITLSQNLKSIDGLAELPSLKTITIPDSVERIESGAFNSCPALESVHFGENVNYIGTNAFYNCDSLVSVSTKDNVDYIGSEAFAFCDSLTYIHISENATCISRSVFNGDTALRKISVPFIGNKLRQDPQSYGVAWFFKGPYVPVNDNQNIVNRDMPTNVKEVEVAYFGDIRYTNAFRNCYYLQTITFLAGHSFTFAASTFTNCPAKIHIKAKSVKDWTKVGSSVDPTTTSRDWDITIVDENDNNLNEIDETWENATFGNKGFMYCKNIESVKIREGITEIGNYCFYGCTKLKTVVLPSTLKNIGASAFYNSGIKDVYFNGTLEQWLNISGKGNLSYFTNYNGNHQATVHIKDDSGKEMNQFEISSSTTQINDGDYDGFDGKVFYKGSLENWLNIQGKFYLHHQVHLYLDGSENETETINIPNSVSSIDDYEFYNCSFIKEINIGDGVQTISENAFNNCSSLKTVDLGNNVTSIKQNAFSYCSSLEYLLIPTSVVSIQKNAFYSCKMLDKLLYKGSYEDLLSSSLGESVNGIDVYCYSETRPTSGNFWHFDENNVPVSWN